MLTRRHLMATTLAWPALQAWAAGPDAEAALRAGGVVAAFRHALAPGTFDPPGFRLGDCSTQRNLSDVGRAQARRLGEWFTARSLRPAQVRSSPWCRCMDTATLAFGRAQAWDALASPRGAPETMSAAHLDSLRQALVLAATRPGVFEVWVTHMFVLTDLAGGDVASGEGLILQADASGAPRVQARLPVPV
jgi:hypothetical protein